MQKKYENKSMMDKETSVKPILQKYFFPGIGNIEAASREEALEKLNQKPKKPKNVQKD
ncbi:hypothetical protein KAR91_86660 [Candidatus Pacearchaeota archaeon]|nr:hypothetical protein [Candidatus Pacearchaeota archaeon]